MTHLHWRDISLHKAGTRVLTKVSLSAATGEVLGIIGPNGAGKTALLRCAAGLEPGHGGRVDMADAAAGMLGPTARARILSFLPQRTEAAWPITAASTVALGRLPHGGSTQIHVARALEAVGMGHVAQRAVTSLSGGERALVLLARALAVEPKILLLDEPGAALDPHHQLAIMGLFRDLARGGMTVCIVLHDLTLAARFCHRVAVLHEGRMMAHGAPETVLTDRLLDEVYAIQALRRRVDDKHLLVPWERVPS